MHAHFYKADVTTPKRPGGLILKPIQNHLKQSIPIKDYINSCLVTKRDLAEVSQEESAEEQAWTGDGI